MEGCPKLGSRAMLFLGGPCTIGGGQVIGLDLVETLRSYYDI